jgi:hypothetical protein
MTLRLFVETIDKVSSRQITIPFIGKRVSIGSSTQNKKGVKKGHRFF